MARINLRAWREEKAAQRQKQFMVNILSCAFLAVAVVLLVGFYFDFQTDRQRVRNNYLNSEIAQLDVQLAEIKELNVERTRLTDRLKAIQDLQSSRPLIVRNFDELVRVQPDGVLYSSLSRTGDVITLNGLAQKSADVSALMRQIYSSVWFGEPNLTKVANADSMKNFDLTVPVLKPSLDEVK
ncbi:PilN domain-containing protein [Aliamphritea ceti]|uniref:PilN domain-containing protein n=1 Tax=Aliamphritea ceti TaxID=1524258 RepID=UPI0021C3D8CE|nr:PilN domain-containing protein [Aliamphritea ceti]